MSEDEYIEALGSISDVNVRAVLLYHHAQIKATHDENWILRSSVILVRYVQPFLAVILGIVLGKLL